MRTISKAKYPLIVAIGVLLAFILVSCGSDDADEPAAAPAPAPAPAQAPAAAPAPAPAPVAAPAPAAPAPSMIKPAPAPPPPPPPAARPIIPATCYIKGQQVSACPEASPHTWIAPTIPPGDFAVWQYEGVRPTKFYESPMSAQLVKEGKLPPLDERVPVPDDRMYSAPHDEIGTYGGVGRQTMHFVFMGELALSNFGEREADGFIWHPFVGKSWHFEDDGRTLVLTMREGLKWSDGEDFDMEDVEFAWTDLKKPPYMGTFPVRYRDPVTGNDVKWSKIDDLNFALTFDSPVYNIMEARTNRGPDCWINQMCWYSPKHFLTQFMPEYAGQAKIDEMMAAQDFEEFNDFWNQNTYSYFNEESPCARAWCLELYDASSTGIITRNHYFWGFDPEGNQLPYLDGVQQFRMESRPVAVFRWFAGEHDIPATAAASLDEVPSYIQNMERGDYSVYRWPAMAGNDSGLGLAATWNEDPFIGQMMRTKDFRIALALAFDRDEINQTAFLGLGVPQMWAPRPDNPFYPGDDYRDRHVQRDLAKSNQMLDALGLDQRDDEGFRLRPDGQRFTMTINYNWGLLHKLMEVWVKQFRDVGIELKWNNRPNRVRQGEHYMTVASAGYEYNPWILDNTVIAPLGQGFVQAPMIGIWYQSKGQEGMAPGPDPSFLPLAPTENFAADPSGKLKQLTDIWLEGRQHPQFSPERAEYGKEIYRIHTDEMITNGMVAFSGFFRGVAVKRNNMRNVPKTHVLDHFGYMSWNYSFEDGKDNINNPGNRSKKYRSVSFLDTDYFDAQ